MDNFTNTNNIFSFNNNSFFKTNMVDPYSQKKTEIACFLENKLKCAIDEYNESTNIKILSADIMCKNGQIFVGSSSIKFDYIK